MIRENKVWGERWVLRRDSTHDTSILTVRKGFRCSWHVHEEKYNLFAVISGAFAVVTEDGEVRLGPGELFNVRPGRWHEFRAYEDSIVVEEAFVNYSEGDIRREKAGGKL